MGTLFASTLRALVREKSLFIWSLAFPILMATIFMFMFANLDGAMEFDPVPTGVVADEAWDTSPFSAVAEALGERGDDQLLDVCRFADGEAAASALVDGEVMGVFSVDEDGEPVLSLAPGLQIGQTTDMDAIDRSILESVVGTYVRDADLMTSIARENPGAFADPEHNHTPVAEMIKDKNGGVWFIASPDEKDPTKAVYAEDTHTHWKYTGKKATQYWYCSNPSNELEGVVNGRYTYWASKSPIPGGIAYENFELTEPFQSGQSYIFGITPLSSEELINHIMK